MSSTVHVERRALVLLPTARDNTLACQVLARAGVEGVPCRDADCLEPELAAGAAAVLVCEEWLVRGGHRVLAKAVSTQPAWSDLPVLVMARTGADSRPIARAVAELGNVTVLERPIRLALLVTAVAAAVRARLRQYQLREHVNQLDTARNELADLARAKDEFLATLAHELRNPLAPMRTGLAVLADARTDGARRNLLHGMLERQVDHMVRLVDDLIDVARLTRGSIELQREVIDLAAVVADAVDLSRPLIVDRGHRLELDTDDGPFEVEADAVRLTQVVSNLLNNSAKYSPPGGVIRVRLLRDAADIRLEVSDEGVGIEPEVLPHVFDMFTQGRDREHRAQDGLGIGLTLVKRLVQLHGGRIEARSSGRGQGAQFIVHLPGARQGQPAAAARVVTQLDSGVHGGGLRVLVVDDNIDAGETVGMLLELLGIEHRVVQTGREALAVLRSEPFPVVLLDIGMPGMDGYEVARTVRADASLQHTRLVALTGWGQSDDLRRTREAGFDHHLTKPVDATTLTTLLDQMAAVPATHG